MIHPYVWNYKKVFTGADGKNYILNGVLAAKKGIDPNKVIEQWNRNYWQYQEKPYTLGESISPDDANKVLDITGQTLYDASHNHHMHSICAIVRELIEV